MTKMKTVKLLAALALTCAAPMALATPTVAEIAQAVDAHQYAKADVLLQDVLKAHPSSAKAHFWEAQVLGFEGRPGDGLRELAEAKRLDAALTFASADRVAKIEARLKEQLTLASRDNSGPLPATLATVPTVPVAGAPQKKEIQIPVGVWIASVAALVIGVFYFVWLVKRHKRTREERKTQERKDQMRQLTDALSTVKHAKLDAKLAMSADIRSLEQNAVDLEQRIVGALTSLEAGQPVPASNVAYLVGEAGHLRNRINGTEPVVETRRTGTRSEPEFRFGGTYTDRHRDDYVAPSPAAPAHAPQTVIVQQNSDSSDLLSAVVLADVLRDHDRGVQHDRVIERDVYVERDRPREAPRTESRVAPDDDDYRRSPPPAADKIFDAGNGGNDWGDTGRDSTGTGSSVDSDWS
ncbi:hypothetical protein [Burkholderia sp. Ac-20365]|uniref:hypothetical protein n=1 Tax=Burkholderia sp. Ac-20365 TaxID=2703897 RepID=UPI00197C183C|nr:hypothetical protein [Burkholderia sp. Ac-20365]MBN3760994.1 hypothetical protein [Burkholderia sp. Ac-20365]